MLGLVLEGGAMRGMFTAGVLDVLMENGIRFDGIAGTSAGAVFGCNYKSGQIGRVIRYNKRFAGDPRYSGFKSLIQSGDYYNKDFCYRVVPRELDVFDTDAFSKDPTEFIVTATDIETGEAVYAVCERGDDEDLEWMRASASMPLLSKPVRIGKRLLLDGGCSDSVPLKFMENRGYDRNVVVLTQPDTYRKKPNAMMPVIRAGMRKYPELVRAMETRHEVYNETIEYIRGRERAGAALVIRPKEALKIKKTEKNPNVMQAIYEIGRQAAKDSLEAIGRFTADAK